MNVGTGGWRERDEGKCRGWKGLEENAEHTSPFLKLDSPNLVSIIQIFANGATGSAVILHMSIFLCYQVLLMMVELTTYGLKFIIAQFLLAIHTLIGIVLTG